MSKNRGPSTCRTAEFGIEHLEPRRPLSAAASAPESLAAQGFVPTMWKGQEVMAKPGQWVMKVEGITGKATAQLRAVNGLLGAGDKIKAVRQLGTNGLVLVETPATYTQQKLRGALAKVPGLRMLEPDVAVWSAATLSNDLSLGSLWGLHNTGQTGGAVDADIDAPEAWDLATGNGSVVVGIADTGIDYNHPDLAANVWRNGGEVAGDGVDNDGNGYVDDVFGWDFFNNDNNPMDDNGHGTHVAGTVAAVGDNGAGVAGLNWNAKVMALKFLGADGAGSLSAVIGAINYATKMRTTYGVDVRVMNHSWATSGYSSALYSAMKAAGSAGILSVAAAGNGGSDEVGDDNDALPMYPANFDLDSVIAVAATDHNDQLARFSNYGDASVDLAAPGVSVLSTSLGGSYRWLSGTSMAAPHVAGTAALAWSYAPEASYTTVRNALLKGVDAKSGLAGKTVTGGRLNAHRTLLQLTATPAAPSGLVATATSEQRIDLAWTDNSANETGFRIYRSADAGATFNAVATVGAGVTTFGDSSVVGSTAYQYLVRAYNGAGESASSNTPAVTTPAAASAPDAGQVKVDFAPAGTPVASGHLPDTGATYGSRGNGQMYGWTVDHTASVFDRNVNADQRLDTVVAVKAKARWEMAVPNGTYTVTVSAGDAGAASNANVWVEGKSLISFVPLAANQFISRSITVTVSDGKLTVGVGSAAAGASRLTHLELVLPTAVPPTAPPPPPASSATRVNFQPASAPGVNGYVVDGGNTYGARNGLTYGWTTHHTANMFDRNANADQRLDTVVAVKAKARWEMAVANGTYTVTVSAGDAGAASNANVWVEGKSLISFVPLGAGKFLARSITVNVTDGRLTVGVGSAADLASRLNFVQITAA